MRRRTAVLLGLVLLGAVVLAAQAWSLGRSAAAAHPAPGAFVEVRGIRLHALCTGAGSEILLIHGKKDLRVPVKQSREMADKLKKAGKTIRYVEQPLGDHNLSREADRLQFLQELEAFLKQHNPA